MFELPDQKYVPYTEQELDALAFSVLNKLERPYYLAKEGYVASESRFSYIVEHDDPYLAIEFDPHNPQHSERILDSKIKNSLEIISLFSEGHELSKAQYAYLVKGYSFCEEFGDFGIEALYPLATFLYLTPQDEYETDYITDHSVDVPRLKTLLVKFFTQIQIQFGLERFDKDFGLIRYLGLDHRGFNFKQLALLLGYENDRTARILASPSTSKDKRINTFKADDGSNRTFIAHEEFVQYVRKHTNQSTVKQEQGKMTATIKLTGGNIRNSHVYLTKVMSMFPDRFIGGSNKSQIAKEMLKLDVGNGKVFETDIAGDKKIFRSREALKAFFENFDVVEGDELSLSTSGNGLYVLRPTESA